MEQLPSSILAEKSVVSVALREIRFFRRAKAEGVDIACFHFPQTRVIWEAMDKMPRDDNGEIDLVSLVTSLQESGNLERAGGAAEAYAIYGFSTSPAGWSQWVECLREMKARRMAIAASERLSACSDSGEAILEAKTTLDALTRAVSGKIRAIDAKSASKAFFDRFQTDHQSGDIPGKSTGIFPIDGISGGMKAGELWVIGAKPSRGKSVLMIQIATEFLSRGESVALFSLEMMAHEVIGRMVSVIGHVDYGAITQPRKACKKDFERITTAIQTLSTAPLWVDESPSQNLDSIMVESDRIRDTHGRLDLIVVDYLQLIRGGRGRNESREEEIARVSGGLKQLAKAMECPVISASQLNEAGQTRESRAIEQDADALLFIVEDGIKVGKMRNGVRNDTLPLFLNGQYQRFTQENKTP